MSDDVLLIERKDAVLWLTLNRPAAMNAVSPALMGLLDSAVAQAETDATIRCVVITGAGKAFCAGADLKAVRSELGSEEGGIARFLKFAASVMSRIEALPKPVIAAVNGLALAGGLEIVLACDLVLAAQSAKLGDAHINFGLLPGGGSSVRLPRKLGVNRAKYLLYSGDALPAAEFVACGFVQQVVADDTLIAATEKLALKLASKSPLALRRIKQLVAGALDQPQEMALAMELLASEAHAHSHDLQEGLAAFAERRAPSFTGR
ncbi:MAG: enoyl-CoA hydratase/isomerase family protein [Rhodospirillales bacterium]